MDFSFRPLTEPDLPQMHRWLNEPGIVRWWEGDDVTWEGVVRDYSPANATDPIEHWIAVMDGEDAGWISCYRVADSPEEETAWRPLGIDEQAAGLDYFVGNPEVRGCGVGSELIRRFVTDVIFGRHPSWTQACAAPFVANTASWRALEKAGFTMRGDIEDPEGQCRLMVCDRPVDPDERATPTGLIRRRPHR